MLLEHQHRIGHDTDLIAPVKPGDFGRQITLGEALHRALQIAERAADVAVDQPCGEQHDHQNGAAKRADAKQRGVERTIQIVGIGAGEEHHPPWREARDIGRFQLRP